MVAFHPVLAAHVLTLSYMSLLSLHLLPILNIYEASNTFIPVTIMKEHTKMVPSSPQVDIIIFFNLYTNMIDSSFIR